MVILLTISSYITPQTSSFLPTKGVDNVDIKSLDDLRRKKLKVGYRQGAFVKPFLTSKVGVLESQLVELRTEVDILDKFQKGGQEDGIDALVAGTHHLVLFKEKYCENFTIVQDVTFKSSGLGFEEKLTEHLILSDLILEDLR
ncbi:glutamate receptor 2.6-like [Beta vulgaris subsp. vulgaris]|uniref:glutamate receptor 2.6-like n=1 Tax=Beta vulgaris subsp. vulgaris TaxID=3555 RepID=UPI0025471E87|nr:glutamate receptor 2.6-like [Beta vulgaris subsp. vulgaris]